MEDKLFRTQMARFTLCSHLLKHQAKLFFWRLQTVCQRKSSRIQWRWLTIRLQEEIKWLKTRTTSRWTQDTTSRWMQLSTTLTLQLTKTGRLRELTVFRIWLTRTSKQLLKEPMLTDMELTFPRTRVILVALNQNWPPLQTMCLCRSRECQGKSQETIFLETIPSPTREQLSPLSCHHSHSLPFHKASSLNSNSN